MQEMSQTADDSIFAEREAHGAPPPSIGYSCRSLYFLMIIETEKITNRVY